MKWTENNITFEGTVEEYIALHPTNQFPIRRIERKRRLGKEITVVDMEGEDHKFVRIVDAAKYISLKAQRNFSATNLCKRTSDRVYLRDYMCKPGLKWSTEPDQPKLNLENA